MTDHASSPEPSPLEALCEETLLRVLNATPEVALVMGASDLPALSAARHRFGDYSVDGLTARHEILQDAASRLRRLDTEAMEGEAALTARILDFFVHWPCFDGWCGADQGAFVHHDYIVKHKDGPQTELLQALTLFHAVRTAQDAEAYLDRLDVLPGVYRDLRETAQYAEAHGVSPPRDALEIVIKDLEGLLARPAEESDVVASFRVKLERAGLDPAGPGDRAARIFDQDVRPAIAVLIEDLEDRLSRADEALGVHRLPDGEAYYADCLKRHTTTDLTAQEVHQLGRDEIARLHGALEGKLRALNAWTGDLGASFGSIVEQAATDRDREHLLAECREVVEAAQTGLRPYFGLYPAKACEIVPCPPELEAYRTTCYYPPDATGARAGLYEINLGIDGERSVWERRITAYHEAYPGHHLQLTVAQERADLPLFRRIVLNAAYIEGWAKYAETLPYALGIDDDPYLELFRQRGELISSTNLALDTGLHAYGWSRDEARRFAIESAFIAPALADYLIDRITVTPAQTCAYRIGFMTVERLRDEAQRAEGAAFDLARFHDRILGRGAMPLSLLQEAFHRS